MYVVAPPPVVGVKVPEVMNGADAFRVCTSEADVTAPVPVVKIIAGADVYPVPGVVMVTPVSAPLVTTAVPVAPVPPPPEKETTDPLTYPEPPVVTVTPETPPLYVTIPAYFAHAMMSASVIPPVPLETAGVAYQNVGSVADVGALPPVVVDHLVYVPVGSGRVGSPGA